jgi:hypothetical protein
MQRINTKKVREGVSSNSCAVGQLEKQESACLLRAHIRSNISILHPFPFLVGNIMLERVDNCEYFYDQHEN